MLFIILFALLFCFLVGELLAARRWKKRVKYAGEYGFTDEEFEEIESRDREIKRGNKWIEWDWFNPLRDIRKARRLGFIRMPVHVRVGLYDEMYSRPSMYYLGKILTVEGFDIGWKDKRGTPRFETNPHIYIVLFQWLCINIVWSFYYEFGTPRGERYDVDQYWEQYLWCENYCNGDLEKGRETWQWESDGVSTWDEKYIKPKYRKQ